MRTRRIVLWSAGACLLGLIGGPAPSQPAGSTCRVEAAGLSVTKEVGEGDERSRAIQGMSATCVVLLVTSDGGGLIHLNGEKSRITRFQDDKGTDLLKAVPKFGGTLGSFPKLSKDGRTCLVEVQSDALPAPGAKSIAVEGVLVLTGAQGQEVVKSAPAKLAKGASVKAGPVTLAVEAAGKPSFGDDPFSVTLRIDKNAEAVASIRFLDAAGKEIAAREGMSMRMNDIVSREYQFKETVTEAVVEVTAWKSLRTIEVPVKREVGVGL